MFRTLLIATFVACTAFIPASAKSQQVCGDRAKIVAHLGSDYKEGRSGIGLAASGTVVELFTAETGTWTMLMTAPGLFSVAAIGILGTLGDSLREIFQVASDALEDAALTATENNPGTI